MPSAPSEVLTTLPASEVVTAGGSKRATARGATFTAPLGWTVTARDAVVSLSSPDGAVRLSLVDTAGRDSDDAARSAWARVGGAAPSVPRGSRALPPELGWNDRTLSWGWTSVPKQVATAIVGRAHDHWTVVLIETDAFDRFEKEIGLVTGSLRPRGYTQESFTGRTANPLDAERVRRITSFVERALSEADIPGAALALVDRRGVVFQGGFGVRKRGHPAPVDADTLFLVGSLTKPLTSLLFAKLVDEGRFAWNTKVTEVYPAFRLGGPDTTSRVEMKHLLCNCTELPRPGGEIYTEMEKLTPRTVLDIVASWKPTSEIGGAYSYSNFMVAAGGFLASHAAYPQRELGAAYDEAMQTRVFGRLGMRTTTYSTDRALAGNHASPHCADLTGASSAASLVLDESMFPWRPAGAAWSSVREYASYVRLELARGLLPDGHRLVSEQNLLARREKQASSGENQGYGLGLELDPSLGVMVVRHLGAVVGFRGAMFFLPEHHVGGVLLASSDSAEALLRPFLRYVLEELFDGRPEAVGSLAWQVDEQRREGGVLREGLTVPPDPEAVGELAHRYGSDKFGTLDVRRLGSKVVFDFGRWRSAVASRERKDGQSSFVLVDPGSDFWEFRTGESGGKRTLQFGEDRHPETLVEIK